MIQGARLVAKFDTAARILRPFLAHRASTPYCYVAYLEGKDQRSHKGIAAEVHFFVHSFAVAKNLLLSFFRSCGV
jgi:hypothetical protein